MAFALPKPQECVECGGEGIYHRSTYFLIAIDDFFASLFTSSEKPSFLAKAAEKFENWIGPYFLRGAVALGLAKKYSQHDEHTQLLAQMLWQEANARGIEMWEWRLFDLPRNVFHARIPYTDSKGRKRERVIDFEGIPNPPAGDDHVWWMDNKAKLKEEFMRRGLPVAKGGSAKTEKEALEIHRRVTPPVIAKPHSGSGSRHTTLHIADEAELLQAFRVGKQVSPQVVIEEELVGPVYRATCVDGKFAAALRRDPPSVVGDGVHTVTELVEEENKNPQRGGPYFSKIQLNEKAAEELRWQKLTLESIPPKGQRVYFHQKVNWSVGGTTADVTDETHPENIELFEKAARELKAPIVGIDFIIKDISKSWKEQERCGILECNSMPFFDNHHLPYEGKPRNVAALIWDMVTPPSTK